MGKEIRRNLPQPGKLRRNSLGQPANATIIIGCARHLFQMPVHLPLAPARRRHSRQEQSGIGWNQDTRTEE